MRGRREGATADSIESGSKTGAAPARPTPISELPLRLVPLERFAPEPEKCNCKHGAHVFATAEYVIRNGCECGKFCLGERGCVGVIARRLVPIPGGFVKVIE